MADELVLIVDDNEKNVKLARDVLRFAFAALLVVVALLLLFT